MIQRLLGMLSRFYAQLLLQLRSYAPALVAAAVACAAPQNGLPLVVRPLAPCQPMPTGSL
jgi:hypothetical protein